MTNKWRKISHIINSLLTERWSLTAAESDLEDIIPSPVRSSHQYSAPLFASIELSHKSQDWLFRGWSSASFTDIRACLRRWVMDPLGWYVPLRWLQRPEYGPGSFHQTVTQQLFCYTKTSRRSPAVPQTPQFPKIPSKCKPTSPPDLPWHLCGTKQRGMEPTTKVRLEDLEPVFLTPPSQCVYCFEIILLRIHIFLPSGEIRSRGKGVKLVTLRFFSQNPDFLWCVSKRSIRAQYEQLHWFEFCPVSAAIFICLFMSWENVLWIPKL